MLNKINDGVLFNARNKTIKISMISVEIIGKIILPTFIVKLQTFFICSTPNADIQKYPNVLAITKPNMFMAEFVTSNMQRIDFNTIPNKAYFMIFFDIPKACKIALQIATKLKKNISKTETKP